MRSSFFKPFAVATACCLAAAGCNNDQPKGKTATGSAGTVAMDPHAPPKVELNAGGPKPPATADGSARKPGSASAEALRATAEAKVVDPSKIEPPKEIKLSQPVTVAAKTGEIK